MKEYRFIELGKTTVILIKANSFVEAYEKLVGIVRHPTDFKSIEN